MHFDNDPIVAISTSTASNAAIGVIRISGFENLEHFSSLFNVKSIKPRVAKYLKLSTVNGSLLDDVLLLFFPEGNSFTGENVLEFFCHGNLLNLRRIVTYLKREFNLREARGGEFTYRALQNGKISLSQVEGLDLLLNAKSSHALNSGFSLLSGELNELYSHLHSSYINHRSCLELGFDFLDDVGEDIYRSKVNTSFEELKTVIFDLHSRLSQNLHNMFNPLIVLYGEPNAGKSTFFNFMLNRERSIVTNIAGTTRDYIEDEFLYRDTIFKLCDTAGLHETDDVVEKIGIEKVSKLISSSFFKINIIDSRNFNMLDNDSDLTIITHSDLLHAKDLSRLEDRFKGNKAVLVLNLCNISNLERNEIMEYIYSKYESLDKSNIVPLDRHSSVITEIYNSFLAYDSIVKTCDDIAIVSQELYFIGQKIEELIGIVCPDDVLNNIFDNFCIGK